jgi:hypothetical protein
MYVTILIGFNIIIIIIVIDLYQYKSTQDKNKLCEIFSAIVAFNCSSYRTFQYCAKRIVTP